MKYYQSTRRAFCVLEKGESALYEIYKDIVMNNELSADTKNKAVSLFGETLKRFNIIEGNIEHIIFEASKKDCLIAYIEKVSSKQNSIKAMRNMYKKHINAAIECNDIYMAAECLIAMELKGAVEDYVHNNPELFNDSPIDWAKKVSNECATNVYKIPIEDAEKLRNIAECYLCKGKDLYIKVRAVINLDEFYERVEIDESKCYKLGN